MNEQKEKKLRELEVALEQALADSNAKSNFLLKMSNELRTPLSAILGTAEIQLQKETLTPKVEEAFHVIHDSAVFLAGIIHDIQNFSRIETGQLEITPSLHGKTEEDSLAKRPGYHLKSNKTQFTREYMPYGKVLVVDDVETNIYVAKGLLIPYGLEIETAASGFDAIQLVKGGNTYDVIFMDYMMPQLDGMETTKFLRESGYADPIIALSANVSAGQTEMFLANGFDAFIPKPIDMHELNHALNEFVRDRQPAEMLAAARRENKETVVPAEKVYSLPEAVLAAFLRDAKKSLAALDILYAKLEFEDERDVRLYITSVHGMKNALEIIGEKNLSAFALDLEQAGREHDISMLLNKTPVFLNNIRSLISDMNLGMGKADASELDADEELLAKQMSIIKEACAEFDKRVIKEALRKLKEKLWSHHTVNDFDLISAYLLHSDFIKVAEIADGIIRRCKDE